MSIRTSNLVPTTFYDLLVLATLVQARHHHQTETTKNDVLVPVLASAVGLLGALVIASVIFWALKSQRKRTKKSRLYQVEIGQRRFSYPEVVKMTKNFERIIGRGGFGAVYYGYLDDTPVAVKIYREARREFQAEGKYLTRIHHKNLINLVGYCNEGTGSALVFEYMAKGDLKRNLTGSISTILTWERRLEIAIDVAKGLDYLHDGCKPRVIHRDVNSFNVLLSENLEAKLSGFSLATSLPIDGASDHVSTAIVGTLGYLDPEYCLTGRVTLESDVYSFGVVLMEMITSQPVSHVGYGEQPYHHLTDWVSSMFSQGWEVGDIVDPRLEGEFDIYSAEEALKIAMACVSKNSGDRPRMGQVVGQLKDCLQMELARLNEGISFDSLTSEGGDPL